MSHIPDDLKYAKSHEWLRRNADGTATLGITDHAQAQLGDIVYVEAPAAGVALAADEPCGVIESVKAASDLLSPIAGEVVETNAALVDAPEQINQAPYGEGWVLRLRPQDPAALDALLDAAAYAAHCADE